MRHLRAALARITGLFTGHRADDDLRDELQAHLEMETAEYIRRGMRPDEARRKAQVLREAGAIVTVCFTAGHALVNPAEHRPNQRRIACPQHDQRRRHRSAKTPGSVKMRWNQFVFR